MTDNADSMFDIASRHTMKSKGGMTNRSKKSKMNTSFVTTRTKKSKAASRKSMKSSILGESLHPIQNEEESSSEESDSRASSYHSAKDYLKNTKNILKNKIYIRFQYLINHPAKILSKFYGVDYPMTKNL